MKTLTKLRNRIALTAALLACYQFSQAQCVATLNPTADAIVLSRNNPDATNTNFGANPAIGGGTWTWGGVTGIFRSFIRFDVAAGLPANAVITGATLNLQADITDFLPGGHQTAGGTSNAATLSPVTAAWNENTLTWNNQPGRGAANNVAVAASVTANQNYALNVLAMVQNMYNVPASNFGFALSQVNEVKWGALIFGSKENPNAALRPTLTITYTVPVSAPVFTTTPLATVCSGSSSYFSINPVTGATSYTWYVDNVVDAGSVGTNYAKAWTTANIGNHTIKVVANGCGGTSPALTVNVSVVAPPVVPAITGNTTVCVNQYTPLSNTVTTGVWASSDNSIVTVNSFGLVKGISAGNATISYTVGTGCTTTVTTQVTVNGTVAFIIAGPSTVCPNTSGNAYTVTPAVTGADYTWNIQDAPNVGVYFPVAGSTISNLSVPGSVANNPFTLRCYGSNACGTSAIVTKQVSLSADVPATPDVTCSGTSGTNTCVNLTVTNFGTSSIQWIVNGVVQSTAATFTRPLSTSVLCTYTSPFGCKASTWYSPAVVCTYSARLAEEIELPMDKPFLIYPNPAKGVFKIDTKGQIGTASIFDVTGLLVREIELTDQLNSYTIEIGTPGVYGIRIKTANDSKAYKIVVE